MPTTPHIADRSISSILGEARTIGEVLVDELERTAQTKPPWFEECQASFEQLKKSSDPAPPLNHIHTDDPVIGRYEDLLLGADEDLEAVEPAVVAFDGCFREYRTPQGEEGTVVEISSSELTETPRGVQVNGVWYTKETDPAALSMLKRNHELIATHALIHNLMLKQQELIKQRDAALKAVALAEPLLTDPGKFVKPEKVTPPSKPPVFEVGDIVRTARSTSSYYAKGDVGKIVHIPAHLLWADVDFNDRGNRRVVESGVWAVDLDNLKHHKPEPKVIGAKKVRKAARKAKSR